MKLKRLFNKHRTSELIIKRRYSPRVKLFIAGLVVILLIVGSGALYTYGLTSAGFEKFSAFRRQSDLREEIKRLKDESLELRETLARAQRTLQMDQVAYQELDRSLKESAKEITKLREESSFYRNIISPTNKVGGLQIDKLNIERVANPGDNQYRYKLVLIQALKHDHTVYGRARLDVQGVQDGRDVTLNFPAATDRPLNINFKYFQEFEGVMKLPRNFQPSGVKVSISTTAPVGQTLEQNYAWPKL
jgi:hypothetical protein